MTETKPRLHSSQVLILQALDRSRNGMSGEEVTEATGITLTGVNIGPIYHETLEGYPNSLYGRGLVVPQVDPESLKTRITWFITSKGQKLARSYVTREKPCGVKVPVAMLDPIVMDFKNNRTYQMELYTNADLKKIRESLSEEYRSLDLDCLKQQIVNRRKTGAYAEKLSTPPWYAAYRESQEFREVERKVLEFWDGRCAISHNHSDEVKVYHRRYLDGDGESVIGREEVDDCISLCDKCHTKLSKLLPHVPEENPHIL